MIEKFCLNEKYPSHLRIIVVNLYRVYWKLYLLGVYAFTYVNLFICGLSFKEIRALIEEETK